MSAKPVSERRDFQRLHARVPLSVLMDGRLSDVDVRVFAAIAYFVFQGTVCRESYAKIAEVSGKSKQQIIRSVRKLVKFEHIKPSEQNKERTVQWLSITSGVFGQKQRAGVDEVISSPSRGRRLASVRTA